MKNYFLPLIGIFSGTNVKAEACLLTKQFFVDKPSLSNFLYSLMLAILYFKTEAMACILIIDVEKYKTKVVEIVLYLPIPLGSSIQSHFHTFIH